MRLTPNISKLRKWDLIDKRVCSLVWGVRNCWAIPLITPLNLSPLVSGRSHRVLSKSRVSTSAGSANTSLSHLETIMLGVEKSKWQLTAPQHKALGIWSPHHTADVFFILNPLLKQGYEGLSLEVRRPQNKDSVPWKTQAKQFPRQVVGQDSRNFCRIRLVHGWLQGYFDPDFKTN